MERVCSFIDGSNFFYGIKSINPRYSDFKFDFERHIHNLCKHRKYVGAYYYNASLKQELDPKLFKDQQRLFARLQKIPGMNVVICKRRHLKIKGDDIHIAVDMVSGAYENKFDTAILYSGDGDFSPVLKKLKYLGKKVELVHFPDSSSRELVGEANLCYQMSKKIVKKFFYNDTQLTIGEVGSGQNLKNRSP